MTPKTLKPIKLISRLIIISVVLTMAVNVLLINKVSAVTASDWKPGRIIDDVVFYNKDSMNAQQIQQFLDAKVPVCDRNKPTTNASYQPPWTCLKEYLENTTTKENNVGRFNPDGSPVQVSGGASAAQIIWNVAQEYGINPQVLIVMLQKEQGLVTDNWPWKVQYDKAMGYACPDTAPCDAQYYGLYNQISSAAWQLKRYVQYPDSYNFKSGATRYIQYSPNAACGGSQVFLENGATAALYNYTPYQPNSGALNNMYGTADCGAYGNRNFWRYFNDWFGSTRVADYDYTFVSSSSAVNSLDYGQKITSTITIKNTGSSKWYADGNVPIGMKPTRLSTGYYQNTAFASSTDPNWLGTKNQIKMTPAVVNPGENATFNFEMVGPNYRINDFPNFIPVVDGVGFMKNVGMTFSMSSEKPKYQFVTTINQPSVINPGQNITSSVVIKNIGNAPWYSDSALEVGKRPMRLSSKYYSNVPYASNTDPNWLGTKNQIKMTPAVVNPGENATFSFELVGPSFGSTYIFKFLPVLDGVTFLNDDGMQYSLYTPAPIYRYSIVSAVNPPTIMSPGQIASANIKLKNTGSATWKNENTKTPGSPAIRLIMSLPWYRNSNFADMTNLNWITNGQIKLLSTEVKPGEIGEFSFTWKAPAIPGTYSEHFAPVADGLTLMDDIGMVFTVTVQ